MFLKIIKLTAILVSVMFISPMIKYQPDILKAALEKENDSAVTQEITISETVAETEETETEKLCTENNVPEKKETVAERETAEESESILETSADTAVTAESGLPEPVTESESEAEVEPESVTESTIVAASLESSRFDPDTFFTSEPSTEHQHTWMPVTEIIHHEAVYDNIHHPAVTETVWLEDVPAYDELYEEKRLVGVHDFCKGCGIDLTTSGMSFEEYQEHERQHLLNDDDASYYSKPVYEYVTETIHHEAEGHYEDRVVREAFDESVLVSEAWDEEVITGYICGECGEVKV